MGDNDKYKFHFPLLRRVQLTCRERKRRPRRARGAAAKKKKQKLKRTQCHVDYIDKVEASISKCIEANNASHSAASILVSFVCLLRSPSARPIAAKS